MKDKSFKRIKYSKGQLLTEKDLHEEQEYQNSKRRLLNRCLHGVGIVCGFDVTISENSVVVEPGLALDCLGREIYIAQRVTTEKMSGHEPLYLVVYYIEYESDPIPGFSDTDNTEQVTYSRITEGFELSWSTKNPLARHSLHNDRWNSCGKDHPIPLARAYYVRNRLMLDTEFSSVVRKGASCGVCHL